MRKAEERERESSSSRPVGQQQQQPAPVQANEFGWSERTRFSI